MPSSSGWPATRAPSTLRPIGELGSPSRAARRRSLPCPPQHACISRLHPHTPIPHSTPPRDVAPELERLKAKALARTRDFLMERVYDMRRPKTNMQIKQNALLRYRYLPAFLAHHAPDIYKEARAAGWLRLLLLLRVAAAAAAAAATGRCSSCSCCCCSCCCCCCCCCLLREGSGSECRGRSPGTPPICLPTPTPAPPCSSPRCAPRTATRWEARSWTCSGLTGGVWTG